MKKKFTIFSTILATILPFGYSFAQSRMCEFTVDTRAASSFISSHKETEQTDKIVEFRDKKIVISYGKMFEPNSLRMNIGCFYIKWTNDSILKDTFLSPPALTNANELFIPKHNDKKVYEYVDNGYKFYFRSQESNCGLYELESEYVDFCLVIVDLNDHSKRIAFELCEDEALVHKYEKKIINTINSIRFVDSDNAPEKSEKPCSNTTATFPEATSNKICK